jgi:hypothetical protein
VKHAWTRGEALGKVTAALVGGFVVFLTFGMAMGTALPHVGVTRAGAVAVAVALCVPVWAGVVGWVVLARDGGAAWRRIGVTTLLLALVTVAARGA